MFLFNLVYIKYNFYFNLQNIKTLYIHFFHTKPSKSSVRVYTYSIYLIFL